ncbi:MAG: rhomboid family intramembrane serine protease [Myxococcota bacterium]
MDWLKKTPIVSLLLVAAIAAVPFLLGNEPDAMDAAFLSAQSEAREYIAANPRLEIDRRGELALGADWLDALQETQSLSGSDGEIELPARMLARAQARLDGLIDATNAERMQAEPAWRLGVLDRRSPPANLFAHAFIHETIAGAFLAIGFLCLAGIALERVWGSAVFGVFALVAIPAAAQFYLALDASSGVPWSGASGLVAAVLGAYCIRGLGGGFSIPGWLLVPFWLGLDVFVARGLSVDQLGAMPWATVMGAFGLGAFVASGLRLANLEGRLADESERTKAGNNPILTRAARLSADGDPYPAFDLLQAAWRDNPTDEQVAEAFYSTAVEVDQPEAAAQAILPILRRSLRQGHVDAAVDHWFPLATRSCEVAIEATAAVRLGEALLDGGHPKEALFSLQLALDNGASAAHATRIVNIARDLDEDLARRAAHVALADPSLDPASRKGLEAITFVDGEVDGEDGASAMPGGEAAQAAAQPNRAPSAKVAATPEPEPEPVNRSQLDRRVSAEHHVVETTAFPLGEDLDLDAPAGDIPVPETSGDVLSHWNDPSAIDSADLEGEADDGLADEALFEDGGLDLASEAEGEDFSDLGLPDEMTDSDQTPMVDSTEEMTSPMLRDVDAVSDLAADPLEADHREDQTVLFEAPRTDNAALSSLLTGPEPSPAPIEEAPEEATTVISLRELKVIDAIPVEMSAEAVEIDADGRGKSKLPLDRIQGVAVAAVRGIVSRPVLIVDCVLNWSDDIGSPMKAIRFRSDRFDPLLFAPGEKDALSALMAWVGEIQSVSRASALPTRKALQGEFVRFDSLEDYEREVLMARRVE